jgi:uncharacterized protein YfaS (alpha-2-macroglobulin family)
MSTQTTAYILIAIARYAGISTDKRELSVSFQWGDSKENTVTSQSPVFQTDLPVGQATEGLITFKNNGKNVVYPRIIIEGIPAQGKEKAARNGMKIAVHFKSADGKDINPVELEQGTDFVAEVTVSHEGKSGDFEEVALTHIVPSGWEIHNERMGNGAIAEQQDFEYQDIRDDRVYTYFDLKQGGSKVFRVIFNASYLGNFYMPMIGVEAMYDATIHARIPGRWISVVSPGNAD